MKRVTPFTAVRGLIATAALLLFAGVALVILPFVLVCLTMVLACCILRSDSWRESWEMFSDGTREILRDMAYPFRCLGGLWVTEARQCPT